MTQHKLLDGLQSDAFEFTARDWTKRELRWRVRETIDGVIGGE